MSKAFIFSIVTNIFLLCSIAYILLYYSITGCAETTSGRIGVLTENVDVVVFNTEETIFTLPKGLTVAEANATGFGFFEPYRFRIIITSDNKNLIDYSEDKSIQPLHRSHFYSTKIGQ